MDSALIVIGAFNRHAVVNDLFWKVPASIIDEIACVAVSTLRPFRERYFEILLSLMLVFVGKLLSVFLFR